MLPGRVRAGTFERRAWASKQKKLLLTQPGSSLRIVDRA